MANIEAAAGYAPPQVISAVKTAMPQAPAVAANPAVEYTPSTITSPEANIYTAEKITQEKMFLPGPDYRAANTNWTLLPVAVHEGQHAYLLYALGYESNMESPN